MRISRPRLRKGEYLESLHLKQDVRVSRVHVFGPAYLRPGMIYVQAVTVRVAGSVKYTRQWVHLSDGWMAVRESMEHL